MDTDVIIVGGGIGGLTAASALRHVGIESGVYERAPEIREAGAGFTIWSNAMKALRRIGLEDAVVEKGAPIRRIRTLAPDGRLFGVEEIEDISRASGATSVCMHRADLQTILANSVGSDRIFVGKECVDVVDSGDSVRVDFADGTSVKGKAVIGADGLRSKVRSSLFGPHEPRYAGYFCYRAITPTDALPSDEALFTMVPGAQIGFFPIGRSGVTYWFVCPNGRGGAVHDSEAEHDERLERICAGLPSHLRSIILDTDRGDRIVGDIFDRKPIRVWGAGRITLLGDAAHPMTPNLGQGACMAIEDGIALADALRNGPDFPAALRAYERARRRRTASMVKASGRLGTIYQLEHPLPTALRTFAMRLPLARRAGRAYQRRLLSYEPPVL